MIETAEVVDYCVDTECPCHQPCGGTIYGQRVVDGRLELDARPTVGGRMCCHRCFRKGPKPLTIVPPQAMVSLEEMANRVIKTREKHGELLQQYHEVWYNSGHTWPYTHFLGVGTMKCPNDLWIYQALMTDHRPQIVIETGTYQGGSALWFAFLMDMLGIDGHVYTIDIDDHRTCDHPRITFLAGDSRDPKLIAAMSEDLSLKRGYGDGKRLICLDADHSAAHVYDELRLYAPMCRVGDWLVVEDTNIGWDGPEGDRGAQGGVERYLREHPGEFRQDVLCERYLLTMNPGGWLQRVAVQGSDGDE
jgi:cephalosporin hydroxylase